MPLVDLRLPRGAERLNNIANLVALDSSFICWIGLGIADADADFKVTADHIR
jgi:hypothetical protein